MASIAAAPIISQSTSVPADTSNNKYIPSIQSSFVIQNESEQDFATYGATDDFEYIVVADSHGRGFNRQFFIELYNSLDWSQFLAKDTWCEDIITTTNLDTAQVGSTLTVWKIFKDRFECSWIGDSSAKIWGFDKKNNLVMDWKTKDHDYNNKEDFETMTIELEKFPDFTTRDTWDIQAKTPDIMLSIKSKVFKVGYEGINMSRALGHKGCYTPLGFDTVYIPREKDMTYRIVTATDGFWQVMSDKDIPFIADKNCFAQRLATAARLRWGQSWTHDNSLGGITQNIKIPKSNWDDIGVATWSN